MQSTKLEGLDKVLKKLDLDQQALDHQLIDGRVPRALHIRWTEIFSGRRYTVVQSIKSELERLVNID